MAPFSYSSVLLWFNCRLETRALFCFSRTAFAASYTESLQILKSEWRSACCSALPVKQPRSPDLVTSYVFKNYLSLEALEKTYSSRNCISFDRYVVIGIKRITLCSHICCSLGINHIWLIAVSMGKYKRLERKSYYD
jgi:hypothetical protein